VYVGIKDNGIGQEYTTKKEEDQQDDKHQKNAEFSKEGKDNGMNKETHKTLGKDNLMIGLMEGKGKLPDIEVMYLPLVDPIDIWSRFHVGRNVSLVNESPVKEMIGVEEVNNPRKDIEGIRKKEYKSQSSEEGKKDIENIVRINITKEHRFQRKDHAYEEDQKNDHRYMIMDLEENLQVWGFRNKIEKDNYWLYKENLIDYEAENVLRQWKQKLDSLRIYGIRCEKGEWIIFISIFYVKLQEQKTCVHGQSYIWINKQNPQRIEDKKRYGDQEVAAKSIHILSIELQQ